MGFLPLEAATHAVAVPAWVYGLIALVALLVALQVVRNVGRSRPHS